MNSINTLDELLDYLKNVDLNRVEMDNLPTFGGVDPTNTLGIWSWDSNRLLVGDGQKDFKIINREDV